MEQGQKVIVVADWLPTKLRRKARGTIVGSQDNGETFYRILWKHSEEYGDLFTAQELWVLK